MLLLTRSFGWLPEMIDCITCFIDLSFSEMPITDAVLLDYELHFMNPLPI